MDNMDNLIVVGMIVVVISGLLSRVLSYGEDSPAEILAKYKERRKSLVGLLRYVEGQARNPNFTKAERREYREDIARTKRDIAEIDRDIDETSTRKSTSTKTRRR